LEEKQFVILLITLIYELNMQFRDQFALHRRSCASIFKWELTAHCAYEILLKYNTIIYIIYKEVTMEIRRYKNEDADGIFALVCRNFIEVNSKDYPLSKMQSLSKEYNTEKI